MVGSLLRLIPQCLADMEHDFYLIGNNDLKSAFISPLDQTVADLNDGFFDCELAFSCEPRSSS